MNHPSLAPLASPEKALYLEIMKPIWRLSSDEVMVRDVYEELR